jgi:ABC-type cobalamin transport system permease subunit
LVKREDFLGNFGSAVMAVAMIGAFLLVIGGIRLARRKEDRGRGFLMMGAAAVIAANVLIWTL